MVIYIDEYRSRKQARDNQRLSQAAAVSLDAYLSHTLYAEHPQRRIASRTFLGSAVPAWSPDTIALPSISDLSAVYAEASLI